MSSSIIHTKGGIPDTGTHYKALIENLREAQNNALILGHLHADNDALHAKGWHAVAENLGITIKIIAELAAKGTMRMQ